MKRIRGLLWILVFALLLLPVFDDPQLATGAYVQNVTPGSATIARITAEPTVLRLEVEGPGSVAVAAPSGARRRHAFGVEGLSAGTEYSYRILGEDGAVEQTGTFRTPPARDDAPVRFCVVGDSGGMPWWVWMQESPLVHFPAKWQWLPPLWTVTTVGRLMAEQRPQFWLHVGDVVYPRGQQRHYGPGFFQPFAELLRDSPCYAVLGNHDVMEDDGRQLLSNLHLPTNDLTGDERLFSFAWGALRVVGLDLNHELTADDPILGWLDRELTAASEPWTVVLSHYPIWSASRQGDRDDLTEHLLPVLSRRQVDLYFSGHDHTYQRYADARGVTLVVTGGGGKSLYVLGEDERLAAASSDYNFCSVEVRGAELELRAVDLDGELLDSTILRLADRTAAELERLEADNPERNRRIQDLLR